MVQRLLLLTASLAMLALAGCGSNDSTGLTGVLLEADLEAVGAESDLYLKMGNTYTIPVTVSNIGGKDVRRFKIRVQVSWMHEDWLGLEQIPRTAVGVATVPGLGAGRAEVFNVPVTLPASNTFSGGSSAGTLTATVDSGDDITEANEGNNVAVENVLVEWSPDFTSGDTVDTNSPRSN